MRNNERKNSKVPVCFARAVVCLLRISAAVLFFAALFSCRRDSLHGTLLKCAQCAAVFLLSFLPGRIGLKGSASEGLFALFLMAAALFGSVMDGYARFTCWDVLCHAFSGAVCVSAVYELLCRRRKMLRPAPFCAVSMGFSFSAAAAWEMVEFVVFSVLKNPAVSVRALAQELGVGSAAASAGAAIRENLSISLGTVEGLIRGEYDTFCDILCALFTSATLTALLARRLRKRAQCSPPADS